MKERDFSPGVASMFYRQTMLSILEDALDFAVLATAVLPIDEHIDRRVAAKLKNFHEKQPARKLTKK